MLCVSACPASEKLHVCTAQIKPWHESFDGLHLVEIKCAPHEEPRGNDWRSWLGGPVHSTAATFLLKIFQFVVAGAVLMRGHSCIYLFFCGFRLAPQTNIPSPGRSLRTAKGGHLICDDATPFWMWSRVFYLPPAGLPNLDTCTQYLAQIYPSTFHNGEPTKSTRQNLNVC